METIEKFISHLIENQFPGIYREDGPMLVAFMKSYYEWMEETENVLWYTRRLYEIKDIDETLDEFITHFKEKYLSRIPINDNTDVRNLVKHSLDLYRSKGTERGVDLLFKLVFGVGTQVYYPGDDIFRLSDGKWVVPMYLEVQVQENNTLFHNKQIMGLQSGAIAFVERVVRRTVGPRLIDVFYISAITGNFVTGEKVQDSEESINAVDCPTIIGSLTSLEISVDGSGTGFAVGDVVDVISSRTGLGGKALVTDTSDITGIITFQFISGGFGYSVNSEILISEKVLRVSNVVPNSTPNGYFQLFETITQPKGGVNYENANGTFANADAVFTYYANNAQKGEGRIYDITAINATHGEMRFFVMSGNLESNNIATTGNAVVANQASSNGYQDRTSTANLMATSSNLTIQATASINNFTVGEVLVCTNNSTNVIIGNGTIATLSGVSGPNVVVTIVDRKGVFLKNNLMYGQTSNNHATVADMAYDIGIIDISAAFSNAPHNYIRGLDSNTTANIATISVGDGASFNVVVNTFLYEETANLNTDLIHHYFHVDLDATSYGFPLNALGNLTSDPIESFLDFETINVGTITSITNINPGSGYNRAPMVRVYDPIAAGYGGMDIQLGITGRTSAFSVGEVVTQGDTDARGLVLQSNSSLLLMQRLSVQNEFIPTVNATTLVIGEDSGCEANVETVGWVPYSDVAGLNMEVTGFVQTGTGAIDGIQVQDSGFGYEEGEVVILRNISNSEIVGSASVNLGLHGRGTGYYLEKGGFLSDEKKLYDGYYYQEFSYEIQSSIALDKYRDMMFNIMHFAGSKMFGALNIVSDLDANTDIESSISDVSYTSNLLIDRDDNLMIDRADNQIVVSRQVA